MKLNERNLLMAEGEGLTVEFKEKYTPKIDRDIVALANGKGGYIILGVNDENKICGEKLTNKMKADILSLGRNCEPCITIPKVSQVDNVVVIEVSGGFPSGMSQDKLGTLSIRRNELIADIFARMHRTERMGSGFKRIRESLATAGLPFPKISSDDFFFIEFERPKIIEGTVEKTTQKTTQKTAQKIIEEMEKNPQITRKELAEVIGLTEDGIKYHLGKMQKEGQIRRVGPDKGGHWEILK